MFEKLTSGYYIEALSIAADGLWYSDVAKGGIHRLHHSGRIDSWRTDQRWIGGILLNEDGCVLSSGPGGIAWLDPASGAGGVLLDRVDDRSLPGVNEMVADAEGRLYFGTVDLPAIVRGEQPGPVGLYRLELDGRVTLLREGLRFTNGMALSSDGRRLYHNESFVGVFAYELKADGSLGDPQPLLDKRDCDGLALDTAGNLWISGFASNEVLCLSPEGKVLRSLPTPAEAVTNLRFGGEDGCDLYITGIARSASAGLARGIIPSAPDSAIYRASAPVPGRAAARTRFRLKPNGSGKL